MGNFITHYWGSPLLRGCPQDPGVSGSTSLREAPCPAGSQGHAQETQPHSPTATVSLPGSRSLSWKWAPAIPWRDPVPSPFPVPRWLSLLFLDAFQGSPYSLRHCSFKEPWLLQNNFGFVPCKDPRGREIPRARLLAGTFRRGNRKNKPNAFTCLK